MTSDIDFSVFWVNLVSDLLLIVWLYYSVFIFHFLAAIS